MDNSVIVILFFLLLTVINLGLCQNCTKNISSSWLELTKYPELKTFLEHELIAEGLLKDTADAAAGHSLMFVNWEDKTLRIRCPEKDPQNIYKWHQYCHTKTNKRDKSISECTKFNEEYENSSYNLIIASPKRCGEDEKLFRTYSCKTVTNSCEYFIHVFIKPLPKILKNPDNIPLSEKGSFTCGLVNCKIGNNNNAKYFLPILGPFNISWRGPHGFLLETNPIDYVNIIPSNHSSQSQEETTKEEADMQINSTIEITNATENNIGFYECIITSINYNINSTPIDLSFIKGTTKINNVNLIRSGIRFNGIVHVHSRPTWYIFIPLGIIGILCAILPFLIMFCPTRDDEADIDNDDDENDAAEAIKKKMKANDKIKFQNNSNNSRNVIDSELDVNSGGGGAGGTSTSTNVTIRSIKTINKNDL